MGSWGLVVQRHRQATCFSVGFDVAGELDDDARHGIVDGDVDRKQRAAGMFGGGKRVFIRLGQVHPTGQGLFEQRRVDGDRSDLRGVGAIGRFAGFQVDACFAVSAFPAFEQRTAGEPVGGGRVDRHPFGQRDHRVLQVGRGELAHVLVLWDV